MTKKIKAFKLKNGVRVVVIPLLGRRSVTVRLFLKVGGKYERRKEAGLSHFLEHMAFKGTKKRPSPGDINREIDGKGAVYNAATAHEYTSYFITSTRDNLEWMLEILADVLVNSTFKAEEVKKEKGVIAEEIRMYKDNPMMGLPGEFMEFLYGKSPIGCWRITGEVADAVAFSRKKLVDFRNKYFEPERMVIAIAGDVKANLRSLVGKHFSKLKGKAEVLPEVEMRMGADKEKTMTRQVEQGHFCLGGEGISWRDSRRYAFRLLEVIMAGSSSSRLHDLIRQERGWAYYVFSISEMLSEAGFWGVQSGVMQSKLEEAVDLAKRELLGLKESLKVEELVRAKEYLLGKTKLLMDQSQFWASTIGRRLVLEGKVVDMEEEMKKLTKVEPEELKDLAAEMFCNSKMYILRVSK